MSFFQNTCKPEGLGGKLMVAMMNSGHAPLWKWGFSRIEVREDADSLDVGCGGGGNVKSLLQKCPKGKATGIDYSPVSVEQSQKCNRAAIDSGRCRILQGDVMALPFEQASFDLVTAFETVYFWPDLTKAFAEVNRVLKSGGTFLICNEFNGKNPAEKKWEGKIEGMSIYTAEQFAEQLKAAGFVQLKAATHPKGWLCVTAQKK